MQIYVSRGKMPPSHEIFLAVSRPHEAYSASFSKYLSIDKEDNGSVSYGRHLT